MESKQSTPAVKPTVCTLSFSEEELSCLDDYSQSPPSIRAQLAWRSCMENYVHPNVVAKALVTKNIIATIEPTIKTHEATRWLFPHPDWSLVDCLDRLPWNFPAFASVAFADRLVRLLLQVGNIGNNLEFQPLLDYNMLEWNDPLELACDCVQQLSLELPPLYFVMWHKRYNQLSPDWVGDWMRDLEKAINTSQLDYSTLVDILYGKPGVLEDSFAHAKMLEDWPDATLLPPAQLLTELWRRVLLSRDPIVGRRLEGYLAFVSQFKIHRFVNQLQRFQNREFEKYIRQLDRSVAPPVRVGLVDTVNVLDVINTIMETVRDPSGKEPADKFHLRPENSKNEPDIFHEEVDPKDAPAPIAALQKALADAGTPARIVKYSQCWCGNCKWSTPAATPAAATATPKSPAAPIPKKEEQKPVRHSSSSSSSSSSSPVISVTGVPTSPPPSSSSSSSSEEPDLEELAASAIQIAKEVAKKE